MMRKNAVCMVIGIAASLIGIRGEYHDKLAIFYTSHRYQELRNMIRADWRERKKSESESYSTKLFVKVKFCNCIFGMQRTRN